MNWGKHRVDVYYEGFPKTELEESLNALAEEYGGQRLGSGFGCGQRDIEYRFHHEGGVHTFRNAVTASTLRVSLEALVD